MLTFLILGVLLVLAIVIAGVVFVMSGRNKAVPTPGSRLNEPSQGRASGHGDN